jgi:hypothetical protein
MKEAVAIAKGEMLPSRVFLEVPDVKAVRAKTGLSQAMFATMIGVKVETLQNWGRTAFAKPGYKSFHSFLACSLIITSVNIFAASIRGAGDIIGVKLLDHIIIGDSFVSFVERGLL